jgi:hypothetical protein
MRKAQLVLVVDWHRLRRLDRWFRFDASAPTDGWWAKATNGGPFDPI